MNADPVNPPHYKTHPSGVECIDVVEHMNFSLGNAVKYIWRAGQKGDELEDLKKARWYLDREIARLGGKEPAEPALDSVWRDVRAFHVAFEHPAPDTPTVLDEPEIARRSAWIEEEVSELREARSITDQADAFIDVIYFAVGGLVNLGIRPGELWAIVHAANMAKLWPDGRPRWRDDGKIIKPEGWEPPEPKLTAAVDRQIGAAV
jgi:predicted HAD superfamily Cof-like phosphohydrolase